MENPNVSEKIAALVTPTLEDLGYELVRIQMSGGRGHLTLQIMAEPLDGRTMVVEDCATISRALSALLDVEDPISGAYSLEISSPGIDRPLVRPRDFERFAGYEAKVQTEAPIDGRKKFRGRLGDVSETGVRIVAEQEEYEVPFTAIRSAKLVMTDELLARAADEQERIEAQKQ